MYLAFLGQNLSEYVNDELPKMRERPMTSNSVSSPPSFLLSPFSSSSSSFSFLPNFRLSGVELSFREASKVTTSTISFLPFSFCSSRPDDENKYDENIIIIPPPSLLTYCDPKGLILFRSKAACWFSTSLSSLSFFSKSTKNDDNERKEIMPEILKEKCNVFSLNHSLFSNHFGISYYFPPLPLRTFFAQSEMSLHTPFLPSENPKNEKNCCDDASFPSSSSSSPSSSSPSSSSPSSSSPSSSSSSSSPSSSSSSSPSSFSSSWVHTERPDFSRVDKKRLFFFQTLYSFADALILHPLTVAQTVAENHKRELTFEQSRSAFKHRAVHSFRNNLSIFQALRYIVGSQDVSSSSSSSSPIHAIPPQRYSSSSAFSTSLCPSSSLLSATPSSTHNTKNNTVCTSPARVAALFPSSSITSSSCPNPTPPTFITTTSGLSNISSSSSRTNGNYSGGHFSFSNAISLRGGAIDLAAAYIRASFTGFPIVFSALFIYDALQFLPQVYLTDRLSLSPSTAGAVNAAAVAMFCTPFAVVFRQQIYLRCQSQPHYLRDTLKSIAYDSSGKFSLLRLVVVQNSVIGNKEGRSNSVREGGEGVLSSIRCGRLHGAIPRFYRGLLGYIFSIPQVGISWGIYETIKDNLQEYFESSHVWTNFVSGGISGGVASVVMRPLGAVVARKQNEPEHVSYKQIIVDKMWRKEGPGAFYKGLGARVIQAIPRMGVFYSAFSLCMTWAMKKDET